MRRLLLISGSLLVVAGLGVLGWLGWQLYGTNIVAERAQREQVTELRDRWERPEPPDVERGEAFALVRVPRFGDDYEMPLIEGTDDASLARGIGHFERSAGPGERGNFALAAHRVTNGEPFRDLPSLRPGDEVLVETRDTTYTYVVATDPNDLVVPFTEVWVLDAFPENPRDEGVGPDRADGRRIITLTTCAELFHTDDRMISFGYLVSSEPS